MLVIALATLKLIISIAAMPYVITDASIDNIGANITCYSLNPSCSTHHCH